MSDVKIDESIYMLLEDLLTNHKPLQPQEGAYKEIALYFKEKKKKRLIRANSRKNYVISHPHLRPLSFTEDVVADDGRKCHVFREDLDIEIPDYTPTIMVNGKPRWMHSIIKE